MASVKMLAFKTKRFKYLVENYDLMQSTKEQLSKFSKSNRLLFHKYHRLPIRCEPHDGVCHLRSWEDFPTSWTKMTEGFEADPSPPSTA